MTPPLKTDPALADRAAAQAPASHHAGPGALGIWALHLGLIGALFAAQWLLSAWHLGNLARIMVLACYAMGFNLAFGYTGLLSLGHALFFGAGLYAMGLGITQLGLGAASAWLAGLLAGGALALALGLLALRSRGVAFMIVTLMFAQAGYLTIMLFTPVTRGEEGFVLSAAQRQLFGLNLADDQTRYRVALGLFALVLLATLALVRARFGRVMIAMRENEERSRMLGYDPLAVRLVALGLSGLIAGGAGAAYGLLFGYVGASFAAIPYSILPLLWVLMGGAGTVLGPFLGVLVMFYLIDWASGAASTASLGLVGLSLLVLVLFAPRGLLGLIRDRYARWLP